MNLTQYYQKIKEVEEAIPDAEAVVVRNQTEDGGKAGVKSAVKRAVAARMVVEGHARLATSEEAAAFRQELAAAYQQGLETMQSAKVQLTVLSDGEMKAIRSVLKGK